MRGLVPRSAIVPSVTDTRPPSTTRPPCELYPGLSSLWGYTCKGGIAGIGGKGCVFSSSRAVFSLAKLSPGRRHAWLTCTSHATASHCTHRCSSTVNGRHLSPHQVSLQQVWSVAAPLTLSTPSTHPRQCPCDMICSNKSQVCGIWC